MVLPSGNGFAESAHSGKYGAPFPLREVVTHRYPERRPRVDKTGPVFASPAGGRLSHRNVERRGFDPAATDASPEAVTFHDLRHAYGSRLASKGLTARAIADAMGHKRTATTEIYIQRFNGDQSDENIRKAMTG
jgi:integrase